MIEELIKYLPAITPGCLSLIGLLGQPPEWVKPKRRARRLWAQTHLIAAAITLIVTSAFTFHPWYGNNPTALTGLAVTIYMLTQTSQTDIAFRKASETHMMHAWGLFIITACIFQQTAVVTASIAALVATAITRRWWSGDATAICVALSCATPITILHPEAALANMAAIGFVIVCAIITAIYKSSKKAIRVPLIPFVITPFALLPLVYLVA
jgi:membrane protein